MNVDVETNYLNALIERSDYELQMYDYLVDTLILVPETFWEPVKVSLTDEQIAAFKENNVSDECPICFEEKTLFISLNCCSQQMCKDCCKKVFKENVKCPYCNHDQRELVSPNQRELVSPNQREPVS